MHHKVKLNQKYLTIHQVSQNHSLCLIILLIFIQL